MQTFLGHPVVVFLMTLALAGLGVAPLGGGWRLSLALWSLAAAILLAWMLGKWNERRKGRAMAATAAQHIIQTQAAELTALRAELAEARPARDPAPTGEESEEQRNAEPARKRPRDDPEAVAHRARLTGFVAELPVGNADDIARVAQTPEWRQIVAHLPEDPWTTTADAVLKRHNALIYGKTQHGERLLRMVGELSPLADLSVDAVAVLARLLHLTTLWDDECQEVCAEPYQDGRQRLDLSRSRGLGGFDVPNKAVAEAIQNMWPTLWLAVRRSKEVEDLRSAAEEAHLAWRHTLSTRWPSGELGALLRNSECAACPRDEAP